MTAAPRRSIGDRVGAVYSARISPALAGPPDPFVVADAAVAVAIDRRPRAIAEEALGGDVAGVGRIEDGVIVRPVIAVVVPVRVEAVAIPAILEFGAADAAVMVDVPA